MIWALADLEKKNTLVLNINYIYISSSKQNNWSNSLERDFVKEKKKSIWKSKYCGLQNIKSSRKEKKQNRVLPKRDGEVGKTEWWKIGCKKYFLIGFEFIFV
jgi:hypothetical protein